MYTIILVLHILVAIVLMLIILLQTGKAGGLGGIFGGGGSDQLFSTPSGSDFIRKTTIILASIFMLTTVGLTFLSYQKRIETVTSQAPMSVPVPPPAPAE